MRLTIACTLTSGIVAPPQVSTPIAEIFGRPSMRVTDSYLGEETPPVLPPAAEPATETHAHDSPDPAARILEGDEGDMHTTSPRALNAAMVCDLKSFIEPCEWCLHRDCTPQGPLGCVCTRFRLVGLAPGPPHAWLAHHPSRTQDFTALILTSCSQQQKLSAACSGIAGTCHFAQMLTLVLLKHRTEYCAVWLLLPPSCGPEGCLLTGREGWCRRGAARV